MPMPTVQTSLQECSLVGRCRNPRELTTTHTTGRQYKVLVEEVVKPLLRTMGIGPSEEQTVHRCMLEGAREVTPFIFNENDYQVSPFLSPYLIDKLMITVFSYRSL